jgi:hypothetical protein
MLLQKRPYSKNEVVNSSAICNNRNVLMSSSAHAGLLPLVTFWWSRFGTGRSGARHLARIIAPQPCIRRIHRDPDHDAAMRIGGEAPGRGPILQSGLEAMSDTGSPPPRIVLGNWRHPYRQAPNPFRSSCSSAPDHFIGEVFGARLIQWTSSSCRFSASFTISTAIHSCGLHGLCSGAQVVAERADYDADILT